MTQQNHLTPSPKLPPKPQASDKSRNFISKTPNHKATSLRPFVDKTNFRGCVLTLSATTVSRWLSFSGKHQRELVELPSGQLTQRADDARFGDELATADYSALTLVVYTCDGLDELQCPEFQTNGCQNGQSQLEIANR